MKISVFEISSPGKEYLKEKLKGHSVSINRGSLDAKGASKAKDADAIIVFIHSKINKELLDKLKNLKLVCTMSAGYDHIDVDYCSKKGIKVCNIPEYGKNTIAEFTLGLILAFSRKINSISSFSEIGDDKNLGFDLNGKTIGIVGVGRIGGTILKMVQALGMKVIAFDHFKDQKWAELLGFRLVSMEELLASSDIISMHIPCDSSTYHMINMKNVSLIKKGAFLVNTARGGLVDLKAVVYALEKGILSGAAIDVFEEENSMMKGKNSSDVKKLKKMKNVILTYHHAYKSRESVKRIIDETLHNIERFSSNVPVNLIRPSWEKSRN